MANRCNILFPNGREFIDKEGCQKEANHDGSHLFKDHLGRLVEWETDWECDCGCHETGDSDDECIVYRFEE